MCIRDSVKHIAERAKKMIAGGYGKQFDDLVGSEVQTVPNVYEVVGDQRNGESPEKSCRDYEEEQ